jgi:hypothetical protein
MFKRHITPAYNWIIKFPGYFYPFVSIIDGERKRGMASYQCALRLIRETETKIIYPAKVLIHSELSHLLGSLIAIPTASFLGVVLQAPIVTYAFLIFIILFITIQEFYIHPKHYRQIWWKSCIDWSMWVGPIVIFLLLTEYGVPFLAQ